MVVVGVRMFAAESGKEFTARIALCEGGDCRAEDADNALTELEEAQVGRAK